MVSGESPTDTHEYPAESIVMKREITSDKLVFTSLVLERGGFWQNIHAVIKHAGSLAVVWAVWWAG